MRSATSDLVEVPHHYLVTCPSHPDDLDTQRRPPSGLPGASVPVVGLVSFASMQLVVVVVVVVVLVLTCDLTTMSLHNRQ